MTDYMRPVSESLRMPCRYIAPTEWRAGWANFMSFSSEIRWEQHSHGRYEAMYSLLQKPYLYGEGRGERPGVQSKVPPLLTSLWHRVEQTLPVNFEACFCNRYCENDGGFIGWHADDSPSIDPKRPIAIVSIGKARTICFRPYANPELVEAYRLEPWSILLMLPGSQKTHQHCVPFDPAGSPRISFVFRPLL